MTSNSEGGISPVEEAKVAVERVIPPEERALSMLRKTSAAVQNLFLREIINLKANLLEKGACIMAYPLCANITDLETGTISKLILKEKEDEKERKRKALAKKKGKGDKKGKNKKQEKSPEPKKSKDDGNIWAENEEETKETYANPSLYFGRTAKDKFWDMYKNYRTFKDVSKIKGTEDPRFAYLKQCKEENLIPKMGFLIGDDESKTLDFENKGLTSRTVKAVADAISKYKCKIENVNCSGNMLKDADCKLIIDSLQNHYKNLISLSFRSNKIGTPGINAIIEAYDKIRTLEKLDLSENMISDEAAEKLFEKIEKVGSKLTSLSLGRNFIGKSSFAPAMANAFAIYMGSPNSNILTIDVSWNSLGGPIGKIMLQSLGNSHTLKSANFSYNLLGFTNLSKGKPEEPAILELTESLIKTQSIEEINVSYNSIDCFGVYCLSYGLERAVSLQTINLTGNPIGSSGVKFLLHAVKENTSKKFNHFEVDETVMSGDSQGKLPVFGIDMSKPEGDYVLDLSKAYDRLKLRKLLDVDYFISSQFKDKGPGQCFTRLKLDNSPKPWPLPKTDSSWNWNWVIEPNKGILRVTFSLKHLKSVVPGIPSTELVEELKKSNKLSNNIPENDYESLCKLLLDYGEKDQEANQVDMIIGMAQDSKLWTHQARELVSVLQSAAGIEKVIPDLLLSITDRLLIHSLFADLSKEVMNSLIHKLGPVLDYTPLNPNGKYKLDLAKTAEYKIAEALVSLNSRVVKLVEKNKLFDRSKNGNKGCFRNESMQYVPMTVGADFKLPKSGIFEFDFIYLYQSRDQKPFTEEQFGILYKALAESPSSIEEKIRIFRALSEYIWLTSDQLRRILELHEGSTYKAEIYIAGIGRVTDYEQIDFIKVTIKPSEEAAMKDLYKRVGILNLFNPSHANGLYEFNLAVYEERMMLNILCDVAKKEGIKFVEKALLNQKAVDSIEAFVKAPPKEGVVEILYNCPDENAKADARQLIGEKYLSWKAKIDFSYLAGGLRLNP